jgi:hypothetical protein
VSGRLASVYETAERLGEFQFLHLVDLIQPNDTAARTAGHCRAVALADVEEQDVQRNGGETARRCGGR